MMTALLVGVAVYTILGGMLSVLVTDFLQFIVMSAGPDHHDVPHSGQGGLGHAGEHRGGALRRGRIQPVRQPDMGWSYVIFNALLNTAAVLTWQTQIARVLAAKDSATGRKVYTGTSFFFVARWLIPGIWGIAALALLTPEQVAAGQHPGHAQDARHGRAGGIDGPAHRRHARRRHEHGLVLHAHLEQRDLQRHPGAVPQDEMVGEEGPALEPHDRRTASACSS